MFKFFHDMQAHMVVVVKSIGWDDQFTAPGFDNFLSNRIHNLLHNVIRVMKKYIKEFLCNDPKMDEVVLMADLLGQHYKAFSYCKNRAHRIGWMNETRRFVGAAERVGPPRALISLVETDYVVWMGNHVLRMGYARIK